MNTMFKTAMVFLVAPFLASCSLANAEFMTISEQRAQLVQIEENKKNKKKAENSSASKPSVKSLTTNTNLAAPITERNTYSQHDPGTIIVRTNDKKLHYIVDNETMKTYPIAVGREGAQWFGTTKVTHKRKNPEWRPTPNMRKRNPKLPAVVKPGPTNPMGIRAIYLAEGYLRIHGTNEPASIGKAVSSGCYRMHNDHVSELYELVKGGAKVVVLK